MLGDEVDDPELLDVPRVSANLVLTNRKVSQSTLGALSEDVGARGVSSSDCVVRDASCLSRTRPLSSAATC